MACAGQLLTAVNSAFWSPFASLVVLSVAVQNDGEGNAGREQYQNEHSQNSIAVRIVFWRRSAGILNHANNGLVAIYPVYKSDDATYGEIQGCTCD